MSEANSGAPERGASPPGTRRRRNFSRHRLAAILILGAVLRVAAWWLVLPTQPILDETDYMGRATRVANGVDISRESARPPGSIWYYAAAFHLFGQRHEVARAANVIVAMLLPLFVWMLGRRIAGERVAWIAALAVAIYPDAVLYACGLWSEPLYHAQSLGAALLILGAELDPGHRLVKLAAAGLLLGIASLTREVGAPLAFFSGLWLVLRSGVRSSRGWVGAAVLGATCFLAILPWSIRQTRARGYPVLITSTNWQNLYFGNVPLKMKRGKGPQRPVITPNFQGYHALGAGPDERAAAARPIIKKAILDRMPWWPFEKVVEMLPRIVSPNSLPTARMMGRPGDKGWAGQFSYRTRLDGTRWEGLRDWIAWGNVASWAVILLGGTAGLVLARGHPGFGYLLLFVAAHLLPQFITHGQSRYRMPIVPILALGLGVLLAQGAARWREASVLRRVATGLAVAGVGWAAGSFWWTLSTPQWG